MRISRLAVVALLVASVSVAAPADAAKRHHPVKRHVKVVKVAPKVAATTAAPTSYRHTESLDFTAGANGKPAGSTLPVLTPYQHCSGFFVPQNIDYFNGPVLVCG